MNDELSKAVIDRFQTTARTIKESLHFDDFILFSGGLPQSNFITHAGILSIGLADYLKKEQELGNLDLNGADQSFLEHQSKSYASMVDNLESGTLQMNERYQPTVSMIFSELKEFTPEVLALILMSQDNTTGKPLYQSLSNNDCEIIFENLDYGPFKDQGRSEIFERMKALSSTDDIHYLNDWIDLQSLTFELTSEWMDKLSMAVLLNDSPLETTSPEIGIETDELNLLLGKDLIDPVKRCQLIVEKIKSKYDLPDLGHWIEANDGHPTTISFSYELGIKIPSLISPYSNPVIITDDQVKSFTGKQSPSTTDLKQSLNQSKLSHEQLSRISNGHWAICFRDKPLKDRFLSALSSIDSSPSITISNTHRRMSGITGDVLTLIDSQSSTLSTSVLTLDMIKEDIVWLLNQEEITPRGYRVEKINENQSILKINRLKITVDLSKPTADITFHQVSLRNPSKPPEVLDGESLIIDGNIKYKSLQKLYDHVQSERSRQLHTPKTQPSL